MDREVVEHRLILDLVPLDRDTPCSAYFVILIHELFKDIK